MSSQIIEFIVSEMQIPETISSFSGAMLFTITQNDFSGFNKFATFLISFLMGFIGADIAVELLKISLPQGMEIGREIGAFVTGTMIVTISGNTLTRVRGKLKSGLDYRRLE